VLIGIKLDGCIVRNAYYTVFSSKRFAICTTGKLSFFFKLDDLHDSVPATWQKVPVCHNGAYHQKKSTEMVANAIAALLTYQLPIMLVQFVTQFPIILLTDLSFPSPIDVIRPRPLRPSSLCGMVWSLIQHLRKFWGMFLVRSVQARRMTLNCFQQ